MHPKHIKTILLLLLVFSTRAAAAKSTAIMQAGNTSTIQTWATSQQADDNEKITSLLIQSQVCEVEPQYEPVKTASYQNACLYDGGSTLNFFEVQGNKRHALTNHHCRLCLLMLFPRHSFW